MDGEQRLVTWTTKEVHERKPCGCNRYVEIPTSNCRQNSHHATLLLLLLEPTQCRRLENDVPELTGIKTREDTFGTSQLLVHVDDCSGICGNSNKSAVRCVHQCAIIWKISVVPKIWQRVSPGGV